MPRSARWFCFRGRGCCLHNKRCEATWSKCTVERGNNESAQSFRSPWSFFWSCFLNGLIQRINHDQSKIIQDHPRSSKIQWPGSLHEGQLEATYGAVCGSRDAPGETGEMTARIKGQRIGFPKRNNSSKKPWGGSTERLPSLFWALLAKAKPHARLPVAVVRPRKRHSGPFGSPDPDSNKKPVFDHCPCGPTCHCWLWSSR